MVYSNVGQSIKLMVPFEGKIEGFVKNNETYSYIKEEFQGNENSHKLSEKNIKVNETMYNLSEFIKYITREPINDESIDLDLTNMFISDKDSDIETIFKNLKNYKNNLKSIKYPYVDESLRDSDNLQALISISDNYFKDYSKLKEVVLAAQIKSIGNSAFVGCSALEKISLFNIESIGDNCFDGCTNLKNIGDNLKNIGANIFSVNKIGNYAFKDCGIKDIYIDYLDDIPEYGKGIFQNCTSLETVKLPKEIKSIPDYTFDNCKNLISVNLNNLSDLKKIGDYAFRYCESLKELELSHNANHPIKISSNAFENSGLETIKFHEYFVDNPKQFIDDMQKNSRNIAILLDIHYEHRKEYSLQNYNVMSLATYDSLDNNLKKNNLEEAVKAKEEAIEEKEAAYAKVAAKAAKENTNIIIGASVGGVVFVGLVVFIIIKFKKRKNRKK